MWPCSCMGLSYCVYFSNNKSTCSVFRFWVYTRIRHWFALRTIVCTWTEVQRITREDAKLSWPRTIECTRWKKKLEQDSRDNFLWILDLYQSDGNVNVLAKHNILITSWSVKLRSCETEMLISRHMIISWSQSPAFDRENKEIGLTGQYTAEESHKLDKEYLHTFKLRRKKKTSLWFSIILQDFKYLFFRAHMFLLRGLRTNLTQNMKAHFHWCQKEIAHNNTHAASWLNKQEIMNAISQLSKVVYIFDMPASGVESRPWRESGLTRPSSTWLHLIRRETR